MINDVEVDTEKKLQLKMTTFLYLKNWQYKRDKSVDTARTVSHKPHLESR